VLHLQRQTLNSHLCHCDAHQTLKLFKSLYPAGEGISLVTGSAPRTFIHARKQAITQIENCNNAFGLACGFRRIPGYYCENGDDNQRVEEEMHAANLLELPSAMYDYVPDFCVWISAYEGRSVVLLNGPNL
jgi:hypothetical protein